MMHIRDQWAKVSSCAFGFPDSESCELLGRHELRLVVVASGAAFSSASDNSGQEKLRANLSRIPEQYLRRAFLRSDSENALPWSRIGFDTSNLVDLRFHRPW